MISANLIATRDGHGHFASRIRRPAANPGQRAGSCAHRAAARMARIAARGGLGVSRAALFLRDARHQNPLQTDRHWRFVGGATAADDYGRLYDFFLPLGQAALPGPAISSLLFCRASPLGLFLAGPQQLHQHRGGKSERDYQSVFPAIDFAGSGGVVGFGGFRDWTGRDGGVDAFFWDPSAGHGGAAAGLNRIGGAHRARGGSVDLGAERFVSRRPRHHALCGAVLDAGVTGGVPEFAGTCALALVIWAESNGRSDRWFSVGADRTRAATRRRDGSLRDRRLRGAARRPLLFPADGNEYRRQGVKLLRLGLFFKLVDIAVFDLTHHVVAMKKIIAQTHGDLPRHSLELVANHKVPGNIPARRNQMRAPLKHEFRVPDYKQSQHQ